MPDHWHALISTQACHCHKADHPCAVQKNENSQRQEYRGPVLEKAMALLNVLPGGQIMLDCEAFHGINACLSSMAQDLASGPDLTMLMPACGLTLSGGRQVLEISCKIACMAYQIMCLGKIQYEVDEVSRTPSDD